jgi:asparagine synthase (glutamine-hydrolysing)
VKPTVLSFGNLDARFRNELARRFGAEATWTGQGGDHIFFEAATNLTAADYIRDHWFGRRFFSAIHDAARLTNEPYWRVMHSGLRKGLLRSKWKAEDDTWGQQPFVVKESLPENTPQYISHPWLADVLDLPPGKQFHIYVLADLLNQTGPLIFEEGAPEHHPLVSQPLLELSVRIPTYELVRGGCGRALARAAFAGRIPESIRTRRSKGTTRTYTTAVISQNKNFIRELLLDGALVRQGLLSRAELDPYLSAGKPLRPTQIFPLVACVAAEAWIQSWTRYTAQRRVA